MVSERMVGKLPSSVTTVYGAFLQRMLGALMVVLALAICSGCATQGRQAMEGSGQEVMPVLEYDPWEGFNRKVFVFNDRLDAYLLKPVAKGYRAVTPRPVNTGISNFFSNLGELGNMFNNALQWKWGKVGNSTGRFVLNSTVGLVGVFDVAQHAGLRRQHSESFGQTLSYWGMDAGPYMVLPFFGPSTVTDTLGMPVDWFTDPTSYLKPYALRYGIKGVNVIDTRASLLDAEELISGDRYSFIRDAYLQRREYLVHDGRVVDDFGGDFGDFGDFDDFDEDF